MSLASDVCWLCTWMTLQGDKPLQLALVQGKKGQSAQLQAEHLQPGVAMGPAAQDASIPDIIEAAVRQTLEVQEQPASGPSADKGEGNIPVQVCSTLCWQLNVAKACEHLCWHLHGSFSHACLRAACSCEHCGLLPARPSLAHLASAG